MCPPEQNLSDEEREGEIEAERPEEFRRFHRSLGVVRPITAKLDLVPPGSDSRPHFPESSPFNLPGLERRCRRESGTS